MKTTMATKLIKALLFLTFCCHSFADKPEWVYYINPMMLGRTYDKSTNQVGVDVINLEDVSNIEMTQDKPTSFMKFKAGESDTSKRDMLDVGGSLALQIKGGFIKVKGSGQYVKEDNTGQKYYELLTLVQSVTRTISLKSEVQPNLDNVGKIIGKHYVSKIQYGASLVASLRYKFDSDEQKEEIKAAIEGSISDTSGAQSFDIQASADLNKVSNTLGSKASLDIKYYADVPLDVVPQTIEDFNALVERFPDLVAATENSLGRPIKAYVQPLTDLIDNAEEFIANRHTNARIPDLENEISDLNGAKNQLYVALKDKRILTTEQEQWVSELYKTILDALSVYKEVISKLDLEGGDEQFVKTNTAFLKIKELDVYQNREALCPQEKKNEVPTVNPSEYRNLVEKLICHIENHRSDSVYDREVKKILDLKEEFMGTLTKRTEFLNNVLTLSKDYSGRADKIFQHYFMAAREGEQSGLQKGATVLFDQVKLASTKTSGYDTSNGFFTAPTDGLYFFSQHVSGTNMDMDNDGQGACPITQAHTNSYLKKMTAGDTLDVKSDTDKLVGQSSFMGILVDVEKSSEEQCPEPAPSENDSKEDGSGQGTFKDNEGGDTKEERGEESDENEQNNEDEENEE